MFDYRMRRTYLLGALLPSIYQMYRGKARPEDLRDAISLVNMAVEELDRPNPEEFRKPVPIGWKDTYDTPSGVRKPAKNETWG